MLNHASRSLAALLILACASALTALPAEAKYAPVPLFDMIGASDLVIIATIDALPSARVMTLAVEEVIHGSPGSKTLDVQRFEDWTCAARWTPYKVGQKAMFFLWRDDTAGQWRVRSAGNEGELPIMGGSVWLRGHGVEPWPAGEHTVHGARFYGQEIDLATFVDAVRGYRVHFEIKVTRHPWIQFQSARPLTDDAAREGYASRSELHRSLVLGTPLDTSK